MQRRHFLTSLCAGAALALGTPTVFGRLFAATPPTPLDDVSEPLLDCDRFTLNMGGRHGMTLTIFPTDPSKEPITRPCWIQSLEPSDAEPSEGLEIKLKFDAT